MPSLVLSYYFPLQAKMHVMRCILHMESVCSAMLVFVKSMVRNVNYELTKVFLITWASRQKNVSFGRDLHVSQLRI